MQVDPFISFTLAILLLFVGKEVVSRIRQLRRYSIPDALVGGALCAMIVCVLYYAADLEVTFDLAVRDQFLLYFFAAIGLNTDTRILSKGGRQLVILAILAVMFMVLQNFVGIGLASLFGMDANTGLMVGSISLTGGVGTTMAWTPHFVDNLGIENAAEVGLSANMVGLMAACMIGGPLASILMRRHHIRPSRDTVLEIGILHREEQLSRIDYYGVLLALLWLNFALILGQGITHLVSLTPITLPSFVGCLIAGIFLRAFGDFVLAKGEKRLWNFPSMQPGVALISDICLGLFLTMALMGLKFWQLQPMLGFITVSMLVQIALVILFVLFVLFRALGRSYESVVICSGFGGIALGSTATAVANMTAVSREFGAAPQAFIVVPLVCGFLIDIANALIISVMIAS